MRLRRVARSPLRIRSELRFRSEMIVSYCAAPPSSSQASTDLASVEVRSAPFKRPASVADCSSTSRGRSRALRRKARLSRRKPNLRRERLRGAERVEASKSADMSCKPLTLVAQPTELSQLDLAQGRPTTEEKRHTLVTLVPGFAKPGVVEHRKVRWKVLDHVGRNLSAAPAPAPYGALAVRLPNSPNHFRILADTLRVICIGTSLPPPSAQWPVRSTRKERLGKRNGSRSPEARAHGRVLEAAAEAFGRQGSPPHAPSASSN